MQSAARSARSKALRALCLQFSVRREPFFSHVRFRHEELDPKKYPLSVPAVREIDKIRFHPAVTILAGENGSGKSTLLEALAVAAGFNAEGGRKSFSTPQESTDLSLADAITLARNPNREQDGFFLRAESTYVLMNYINMIERENPPIYGNLHLRSHGESFFDLFQIRFSTTRNALFILDEIESALSPQRQLEFLALMHWHVGRGSSFIVSTHSPILMSYPQSRLYWLDKEGIRERDWRETDHFLVYQAFTHCPEVVLKNLLLE
ncbi:AAA family ATPase [bacterium]|nr:MAG: AAA family ATPase [bacterium]